jgi:hypothetical protein
VQADLSGSLLSGKNPHFFPFLIFLDVLPLQSEEGYKCSFTSVLSSLRKYSGYLFSNDRTKGRKVTYIRGLIASVIFTGKLKR